jgi:hypothetical protein
MARTAVSSIVRPPEWSRTAAQMRSTVASALNPIHRAVGTEYECRFVAADGDRPGEPAVAGGMQHRHHHGEEGVTQLGLHRPVQAVEDHPGIRVLGGLGADRVAGERGDLRGLDPLAAHVPHHHAPRVAGAEQVVEVADDVDLGVRRR